MQQVKTNREDMIAKLIEFNLDLAQNSTEWNDTFIYDALRYGLKGFEQMTDAELSQAVKECAYD